MQGRRAFLSQSLALAAVLATLAPGRGGAGPVATPLDMDGDLAGNLPVDIAALDVRALGGGAFLVSGWVLTAADLAGLGVDPAAVSGIASKIASGATGPAHRVL